MDRLVRWSPEAEEDLDSIAQYIARDSEFYARSVVSRILETTRKIPDQPLKGRIVPEIGHEQIRERLVYSYRLVHQVQADGILIVAIIHGRRLLESINERL